jgi:alpha-L-fucosidase
VFGSMRRPHRSPAVPVLALLALLALAAACGSAPTAGPDTQKAPADQDERMAWWRDARFGMFLHWGLYSIPAGKWGERTDHGEWIRESAHIPVEIYEQFQPNWNPEKFDADAWAQMAADAGMKYVVITSKHHDGFCLWDSKQTTWDVGKTRNPRDVLGELADACRRRGIVFCTYHSIMDWHHPDYLPRRSWEKDRPAAGASYDRFEQYLHAEVAEIIERYRPGVMWFDGEWENTWSHERGVRLFELCRRLAPGMIVNNRVDVHRGGMGGFSTDKAAVGDFATPEQEIPATGLPGVDWESCMTMNDHWGFNAADANWKSAKQLVRNLIDIASKGGNYLLNIGPRADGTFPPEAVERLQQIGAWMKVNGEAIHGTSASPFDALPWGRCTVKLAGASTRLYLHVFDWPSDGKLVVPGLATAVVRASLFAEPAKVLAVHASTDGVTVDLPGTAPDAIASVVVLELAGAPVVWHPPTITAESDTFLSSVSASLDNHSADQPMHYTLDGSDVTNDSPTAAGPIRIAQSCTLKAATFARGARVSAIVERKFTKLAPLPAVAATANKPGLVCEHFAVDWSTIPADRTRLVATARETVASVGPLNRPGEKVAFVYRGFLRVPHDELYRFELTSDDGSKLWIDGQVVVDNDGLHGPEQKRGALALAAGLHTIEVVWFNATGGAELELEWAPPGQPFAPLTEDVLRH